MKRIFALLLITLFLVPLGQVKNLPEVYSQIVLKDIKGHTFESEILRLWKQGYLKGYPDGTFKPDAPINRAEVAVLLTRVRKLSLSKALNHLPFKDVSPTHWAYSHIQAVYRANLMRGYPDGTFKPEYSLTRAELGVLLGKAKGLDKEVGRVKENIYWSNDESTIPGWAASFLTLAYYPEHQFLTYRPGRLVAANARATRGEVAYGLHSLIYPPKTGSILNIVMNHEPDTLSTWTGFTAAMNHILGAINIPAIGRDESWVPYPGYLKDIPSVENGRWKITGSGQMEITFTIRENLRWSNGKKVNIDDWAYAFAVFMDPQTPVRSRVLEEKIDLSKGSGGYGIRGFEVLNQSQIKFFFKEIDWRANTSPPGVGLYFREHLEPAYRKMKDTGTIDHFVKDENLSRKPIGMGPYRIVDWRPGVHIIMEKNPFYAWGNPLTNRLVIRFIPDTTTLLAQVISGRTVDAAIMGVTFDQALALEARPPAHLKVFFSPGTFVEHIAFNLDNPILSDLRVRKALAYSIDRERIIKEFYGNRVELAHSFFNPRHWAYDDSSLTKYSFDPEKARNLLEEAGWKVGAGGIRFKDGVRLSVELRTTSRHALREKIQSFIQQQWKDIGVEMRIRNLPSTIFFSRTHYTMRAWPSMLLLAMPFEPLFMGETVWREDQIPTEKNNWSGSNIYGYRNAEVTDALKKAEMELRETERKKLLSLVQKKVSNELPIFPINYTVGVSLYKTNLVNYRPLGLGPITWNIHYWYFR
ncbi:MAG: Oligopeptide-binding protein AppA [candidate division WS2 bacterium]|nr:Oligopeptide-binding protein AppA [Candidatus Lithacetigena glycinireducens]